MSKILEKYHSLPPALKASFWFAICSVFQKGISLLATPLYTRLLTQDQYGYFSVYQSWLNIVTVFATLNLSAGVFNNILNKCDDEEKQLKALSAVQALELIVTLVTGIALIAIKLSTGGLISLSISTLLFMMLQIVMNSAAALFMTKEKFNFRYIKVLLLSVGFSMASFGLSILFIYSLQNKDESLIIGNVVASTIAYTGILIYNLARGKKLFDGATWKYALLFNLPLIPHYLSQIVLSSSDRIMIESFLGKTDVALYSIAHSIGMLLTFFTVAINSALVPWTYKKLKKRDFTNFGKVSTALLGGFAVICIFIILLTPEIVFILGGEQYAASVDCVPPIAVSAFLMLLYPLYGNIEFFYEKRLVTMLSSIAAALLNVGLNWWLIPIYGYVAAAYTTLVGYGFLTIVHFVNYAYICKKNQMPFLYSNIATVIAIGIVAVFGGVSALLYDHSLIRYITIGVVAAIMIIGAIVFLKLRKSKAPAETPEQ